MKSFKPVETDPKKERLESIVEELRIPRFCTDIIKQFHSKYNEYDADEVPKISHLTEYELLRVILALHRYDLGLNELTYAFSVKKGCGYKRLTNEWEKSEEELDYTSKILTDWESSLNAMQKKIEEEYGVEIEHEGHEIRILKVFKR